MYMNNIEKLDFVRVYYTGRTSDGEVFDSNVDGEPLSFRIGSGQVIEGFENSLYGKEVGDVVTTETITPEDGYGEINNDLIFEVNKTDLPEPNPELGQEPIEVGTVLEAQGNNGESIPVRVIEINEETVKMDANHILAGKEIIFEIQIVGIDKNPFTESEGESEGENTEL